MKRSRYSDGSIPYAVRQAESGTAVADVCRQLGIAEATFSVWKKKFANLGATELRELREPCFFVALGRRRTPEHLPPVREQWPRCRTCITEAAGSRPGDDRSYRQGAAGAENRPTHQNGGVPTGVLIWSGSSSGITTPWGAMARCTSAPAGFSSANGPPNCC